MAAKTGFTAFAVVCARPRYCRMHYGRACRPGEKRKREKAILVVSFGTSYEEALSANIEAAEKRIAAAYPNTKTAGRLPPRPSSKSGPSGASRSTMLRPPWIDSTPRGSPGDSAAPAPDPG